MAEKITASWFNKIITAIERLHNLEFAFSITGLPQKININADGTTGKLYTPTDFSAINTIIERMSNDSYLKQTNNNNYPNQQIYYNTVAVGKVGEKPLLSWKQQLDTVVDSWGYITCHHGTPKSNGPNNVTCSYGAKSNGTCAPHGTNTNTPVTKSNGAKTVDTQVKNTNKNGFIYYKTDYSKITNTYGTKSNGTAQNTLSGKANGSCSQGYNSHLSHSNTCSQGTCSQGSDINIRYKTTEG